MGMTQKDLAERDIKKTRLNEVVGDNIKEDETLTEENVSEETKEE